jgi:hypothetical protein
MSAALSRMDAIQAQQMALEAERHRQREITRIDLALERITQGEFGCAPDAANRSVRRAWRSGNSVLHPMRGCLSSRLDLDQCASVQVALAERIHS